MRRSRSAVTHGVLPTLRTGVRLTDTTVLDVRAASYIVDAGPRLQVPRGVAIRRDATLLRLQRGPQTWSSWHFAFRDATALLRSGVRLADAAVNSTPDARRCDDDEAMFQNGVVIKSTLACVASESRVALLVHVR